MNFRCLCCYFHHNRHYVSGIIYTLQAHWSGRWLGSVLQACIACEGLASLVGTQVNKLFLNTGTSVSRDVRSNSSSFYFRDYSRSVQEMMDGARNNETIINYEIFVYVFKIGMNASLEKHDVTSIHSDNNLSDGVYPEFIHTTVTSRNVIDGVILTQPTFTLTNLKSYYAIPFYIMLCCCIFSWLIWVRVKTYRNVLGSDQVSKSNDIDSSRKQCTICVLVLLLELLRNCYFYGIGSLMVTYVIKHLKFEKTAASDISFTFFMASSVMPIPMMFLLRYISPKILLGVSLVLTTITMMITWLIIDHHMFIIWIWAVLCGVLVPGGQVPSCSWYTERSNASATDTSFLVAAYALGAMIGPGLTGLAMSFQNPAWFMHSLLAMVIVTDIIYVGACIVDWWNISYHSASKSRHKCFMLSISVPIISCLTQTWLTRPQRVRLW